MLNIVIALTIIIIILIISLFILRYITQNKENFTIESDYVNPNVEIKISDKLGVRGVFSNRDYKAGDIIEVCPCIKSKKEFIKDIMLDYVFTYDDEHSLIGFGYCSMYNHSDDYNALWTVLNDKQIKVYATKDIKKGDEIFISYGPKYWESRKNNYIQ